VNISIIIPTLHEGRTVLPLLEQLQEWRRMGDELLLVDGGSTVPLGEDAAALIDVSIDSSTGRSVQLNAGAKLASKPVLWFLHADSDISGIQRENFLPYLRCDSFWGFFNIKIADPAKIFRMVETLMNLRSRTSFVATGDQGIFVAKDLFFRIGGYKSIALMEDIELCKALRKEVPPKNPKSTLITSARRWRSKGVVKTIFLMWFLRLAWIAGLPSKYLKHLYDR
jgi:rSAM/selenodomain-associated transferase 2